MLPRLSVVKVPTVRSSMTTANVSRPGRPMMSTSSSTRRSSRVGGGILEFDFTHYAAPASIDEGSVLLGVPERVDTRAKLTRDNHFPALVADLHDVRFRYVTEYEG